MASVLPDAEALVTDYLLASSEVEALVGDRIYSELPEAPVFPLITLGRVGGLVAVERRLDAPEVELQGWAETKGEARLVAATAQAVLEEIAETVHTQGVVSGMEHVNGLQWVQDPETGRPRYIFEVRVFTHPS